jgi:hypothetical protein
MTDLEKKKQEAWIEYIESNPTEWEFHRKDFRSGFDAGVKAECERVKKLLIDSLELDVADYLFPGETKNENNNN